MIKTAEPPVLFDLRSAARTLGAEIRGKVPDRVLEITGVSHDSRECRGGTLFFALKGERTDGHEHLADAFARGAAAAVVSRSRRVPETAGALLAVEDPLSALQKLAAEHLKGQSGLTVIGVTGSSGKTTVKELIGAVLSRVLTVAVSPGNLNSEIGLPLSAFLVRPSHRAAVFEMGINHQGEMDVLAGVARPNAAVITNIGTAHVGILGSRDAIAREKKKIFRFFGPSSLGFLWEDDPYGAVLMEGVPGRFRFFGTRSSAGAVQPIRESLDGGTLLYRGKTLSHRLPGRHNLVNVLCAVAVAEAFGVRPGDIAEGIASCQVPAGRGALSQGAVRLIEDYYNANPESMRAALDLADGAPWEGRKIYVLGSMKELGDSSAAAHERLGIRAGASRADELFFFGTETREARKTAGRGRHTDDFDELSRMVSSVLRPGDLVLLKGSRSMGLERLAGALRGLFGGGP